MKITREFNPQPLYDAFKSSGLTQRALAEQLSIEYFALHRILHGKRDPNEVTLHRLCERLGVPVEACVI